MVTRFLLVNVQDDRNYLARSIPRRVYRPADLLGWALAYSVGSVLNRRSVNEVPDFSIDGRPTKLLPEHQNTVAAAHVEARTPPAAKPCRSLRPETSTRLTGRRALHGPVSGLGFEQILRPSVNGALPSIRDLSNVSLRRTAISMLPAGKIRGYGRNAAQST